MILQKNLEHLYGNLYRLMIPLPNSPLKFLNSYITKSGDRNLIIDTGFNHPECLKSMLEGINELELDMTKTDILATHLHSDHTGLISHIITDTSKVYMGKDERLVFSELMAREDVLFGGHEDRLRLEGYPEEELIRTRISNPARLYKPSGMFDIISLCDGDTISYGGINWEIVETPGHTSGHICLYDSDSKTMITGDNLLFDITPNIAWSKILLDNTLSSYLASLNKISRFEVDRALTGHRQNDGSFQGRIQELHKHHEHRLNDVLNIVGKYPYICGYDIAAKMEWSIRVKSWDDFPPGQRWFAVGEALSHINYLQNQGKLQLYKNDEGIHTYYI